MAGNGYIFKRVEKKYMLTRQQYEKFLPAIEPYMAMDQYGLSKICNIYFDTEDDELVRRSNEKPVYKEKMRLRSYGVPKQDDVVFLELKKKYEDVVYKRRIALRLCEAEAYLLHGILPEKGFPEGKEQEAGCFREECQILKEIDYFIHFHKTVPKIYIAYDRTAWYGKEDADFRMTFDSHIRSRRENLSLGFGDEADELFGQDYQLLEIKAVGAYPMWLVKTLEALEIYPVSFSKYGTIYKMELAGRMPDRMLDFQKNMQFLGENFPSGNLSLKKNRSDQRRNRICLPV